MGADDTGTARRVMLMLEQNAADHEARRAQQIMSFAASDVHDIARAVVEWADAFRSRSALVNIVDDGDDPRWIAACAREDAAESRLLALARPAEGGAGA